MHISLDSALGRQRRLNSVGESITQIAPDPAAAYSLRSLTGGDPKVVRVRRGSDNHEQDFTASDVSSGALQDFVNAQVVAPLDIQALSATGRDGDFLIAKAAYSLRSLGTRQATLAGVDSDATRIGKFVCQVRRNVDRSFKSFKADEITDGTLLSFVNESFTSTLPLDIDPIINPAAAAYSLRNLSSSYSGNVVEVRRDSDDTTQNFTAAEITDGTLLSFVNENITIYTSDYSAGNDGWTTTGSGNRDGNIDGIGGRDDNLRFTSTSSDITTNSYLRKNSILEVGSKYTVTFDFYIPSSNNRLNEIASVQIGGQTIDLSSLTALDQWVSASATSTTATTATNIIIRWEDSSESGDATGDVAYIRNVSITSVASSGFVKTWYDQSGNSKDATQATAGSQPKIVNSGALLTDGVTFDGGDSLSVSGDPVITASSSGTYSAFSVQTVATSEEGYLYGNASASNGSSLYAEVNNFTLSNKNSATIELISNIPRSSGQNLLSAVYNNGDAGLLVNGAGTMTDTGTYNFSAGSSDFIIGNRNGGTSGGTFLTGSINEIIVYNSNQTENRRAIEESIATNYGITLASFNRDGFVKTWYDQSVSDQAGTATQNHAIQTDNAKQPKIVSAGALNTSGGLEFDATDDFFALTSTVSFENLPLAMFSVQDSQDNHNHHTLGCDNSRGIGVSQNSINYFFTSSSATLTFSSSVTGLNLYTAMHDGTTNSDNITGHRNGVANSSSSGSGFGEANTTSVWKNIGVRSDTNDFFEGTIKEIIVYNTDQTDNRTAIEANIGEVYSIDLPSGVDPGFDQVDGFVETWYDQSGNGNNATQATASLQPKIVSAGSYLGLIRTDGVDDFFDLTTQIDFNSSHGVFAVYADAGGNRFSLIGRPASTGGMGYNNASASSIGVGIMHINGAQQNATISGIDKTQQNTLYILWQPDSASAIYGVSGSEVTRTFTSDGGNANFTDDVSIPITVIGKDDNADAQQDFKEIIIYATDQTSKRTTLEANMAAAHGITLS